MAKDYKPSDIGNLWEAAIYATSISVNIDVPYEFNSRFGYSNRDTCHNIPIIIAVYLLLYSCLTWVPRLGDPWLFKFFCNYLWGIIYLSLFILLSSLTQCRSRWPNYHWLSPLKLTGTFPSYNCSQLPLIFTISAFGNYRFRSLASILWELKSNKGISLTVKDFEHLSSEV